MSINLVLFGLKFLFIALLYLFIVILIRTVIKDTKLAAGVGADEPAVARLVLNFGKNDSKSFALTEKLIIGRAETADIHVDDDFASSNHVRVYRQGNTFLVQDLKSTNGTKVNGEVTKKATLNNGDEVMVGKTIFKFLQ